MIPYIFVDAPAPLLGGREIYGFPKQPGDVIVVSPDGSSFEVRAHCVDRFAPDCAGRAAHGAARDAPGRPVGADTSPSATARTCRVSSREIAGWLGVEVERPSPAGVRLLGQLARGEVPVVLLKQFRDAADPCRACYQAVIEVEQRLLALSGGGPLGAGWSSTSPTSTGSRSCVTWGCRPGRSEPAAVVLDRLGLSDRPGPGVVGGGPVSRRRKRVAVLGGGAGAMAAAYALSGPGWQKRIREHHRLPARLASRRERRERARRPGRIEEHGLHIWFGFYRNAFAMLDACYRERGEARARAGQPEAAFPTVADAFEPASTFVLTERREGTWHPWIATFPEGGDPPWAPPATRPSGWDLVVRALAPVPGGGALRRAPRATARRRVAGVRLIPVDGDDAAYRAAAGAGSCRSRWPPA